MTFVELLEKYGMIAFALIIFFGGRYGLKYFTLFKRKVHNFLAFATLFALIFLVCEIASGTFDRYDLAKYFLTYAVVTTSYENVVEWLPFLKQKDGPQPPTTP